MNKASSKSPILKPHKAAVKPRGCLSSRDRSLPRACTPCAPDQRGFVKCTEAALTPLREKGIRLATYIDDWLVTARSEQEAREHTVMLLEHIQKLGLK